MSEIANYFKQSAQNIEKLQTFESKIERHFKSDNQSQETKKKNYLLQVMVVRAQTPNTLSVNYNVHIKIA